MATESWDPSAYISTVTGRAYDQWGKSNDQYNWAKEQFAKNSGITDKVVNRALDTGQKFGDWADTDRADYETYRPAMADQLKFAMDYNTPERMAQNVGSAVAGSRLASGRSADNAKMALMSYGVDPSSGRFAGLDAALASKGAADASAKGYAAARGTEAEGQQYLANAIKTGQVLPGQVIGEAQAGLNQNSLAVNAALANTKLGDETMGNTTRWAGLGNDMIKEWLGGAKVAGELNLGQQKIDQGASSGQGALLGAGLGALGGAAKSYFENNPSTPTQVRRGGRIRKFKAGGIASAAPTTRPDDRRPSQPKPLAPQIEPRDPNEPEVPDWMRPGGPMSPEAPDVPRMNMGGMLNMNYEGDDSNQPQYVNHRGGNDRSLDYIYHSIWAPAEKEKQQESGGLPGMGGGGKGGIPGGGKGGGGGGGSGGGIFDGVYFNEQPRDVSTLPGQGQEGIGTTTWDPSGGYNVSFSQGGTVVPHLYAGGPLGDEQGDDQSWDDWTNRAPSIAGMDPTGIGGYAGDAIDLFGDIAGGADHDKVKGDPWGIFGDTEYDQGEQIGGSAGSLGGRAIGTFFGAPGIGAKIGRTVGPGIGAMFQGRFGEGFEDIGRGIATDAEENIMNAGSMGGGLGGGGGGGMGGLLGMLQGGGGGGGDSGSLFEQGGEVTPGVTQDDEFAEGEVPEGEPHPNSVPRQASPSGGNNIDDVHAMVQVGEFVMPEDVSRWYGEKYFQGLIEKARRDMSVATAQPEQAPMPQAMAISPPSFRSEGARG